MYLNNVVLFDDVDEGRHLVDLTTALTMRHDMCFLKTFHVDRVESDWHGYRVVDGIHSGEDTIRRVTPVPLVFIDVTRAVERASTNGRIANVSDVFQCVGVSLNYPNVQCKNIVQAGMLSCGESILWLGDNIAIEESVIGMTLWKVRYVGDECVTIQNSRNVQRDLPTDACVLRIQHLCSRFPLWKVLKLSMEVYYGE